MSHQLLNISITNSKSEVRDGYIHLGFISAERVFKAMIIDEVAHRISINGGREDNRPSIKAF